MLAPVTQALADISSRKSTYLASGSMNYGC